MIIRIQVYIESVSFVICVIFNFFILMLCYDYVKYYRGKLGSGYMDQIYVFIIYSEFLLNKYKVCKYIGKDIME